VVYHGTFHESLLFSWYEGECVYQENTLSDKWDILWYTIRERCINYFIPCHKKYSGQQNPCDIHVHVAHDGKVGCNTVKYATAFLYSDWLYFLWHDIDGGILTLIKSLNGHCTILPKHIPQPYITTISISYSSTNNNYQ